MKSVTTIHHNSGAITKYSADSYIEIIRTMLDSRDSMWVSWHGVNDIIALAREEVHSIGASETVEFIEINKGMLVSSYFLDSLLVIIPDHSEGYILRVVNKADEELLYKALATEAEAK